jgi:hypothetical protein
VDGKFNTSTGHDHDGSDSKKIPIASIDATGTPSSSTALKGDGTWGPATYPYESGSLLEGSIAATERTSTSTSYTKKKELLPLPRGGVVNVSFEIEGGGGGASCFGKIYLNDIAAGTEKSNAGAYTAYTEDISVNPGDKVQLYIKSEDGGTRRCRNLKVLVANPTAIAEVSGY